MCTFRSLGVSIILFKFLLTLHRWVTSVSKLQSLWIGQERIMVMLPKLCFFLRAHYVNVLSEPCVLCFHGRSMALVTNQSSILSSLFNRFSINAFYVSIIVSQSNSIIILQSLQSFFNHLYSNQELQSRIHVAFSVDQKLQVL